MSEDVLLRDPAFRDAGLFFPSPAGPRGSLLGLNGMPAGEIRQILDHAADVRETWRRDRRLPETLKGVAVANAFFEDSTRTRLSFELAERRLGAVVLSISGHGSSVSKGESLLDTVRTLEAMGADLMVIRYPSAGLPESIARRLEIGIVNAGDGAHEHPTQGLLDLLTLRDAWSGRFEGRRLAIVGDLAHSRVARSAIAGLAALGVTVMVAGPPTLIPAGIERLGCTIAATAEQAIAGADAVMALRLQRERMEAGLLPSLGEYARVWGIDRRRLELAKREAVVLHPGPLNRGIEIAAEVADGPRSVILDQVENGVAVRCAVLERCAGVWS